MTRPSSISGLITGLIVFGVAFAATGAGACPPGWFAYDDGACHPPCALKNSPECDKPQVRCDGECDQCGGMRGAAVGETGGPAGGCKDCGPMAVCELCVKKPNCTPTMHPSRFKHYKKKPVEPDPVDPLDKKGVFEKPGTGIGDVLEGKP